MSQSTTSPAWADGSDPGAVHSLIRLQCFARGIIARNRFLELMLEAVNNSHAAHHEEVRRQSLRTEEMLAR